MTNPVRSGYPVGDTASAVKLIKVTPDDTTKFKTCRGLLVGTAGAADLIDASNTLCVAVPLQQGFNPISVQRINLTNLSAANIWALY